MSQRLYVELDDRGVVTLDGPDAGPFLQGLISNDVDRVSDERSAYAALLTPQGKFLHDFFVLRRSAGLSARLRRVQARRSRAPADGIQTARRRRARRCDRGFSGDCPVRRGRGHRLRPAAGHRRGRAPPGRRDHARPAAPGARVCARFCPATGSRRRSRPPASRAARARTMSAIASASARPTAAGTWPSRRRH